MTIPQCLCFTEKENEVQGEDFCLKSPGRPGQGPGSWRWWRPLGGLAGPRLCRRVRALGRSRRGRSWSLQAMGASAAPLPCCPGPARCGRREPGAGSRARARAPLYPAAAASLSLGGLSAGRYLLSPDWGPFPPSRPAGTAVVTGRSRLIGRPRQGLGPGGRRDGGETGPRPPALVPNLARPSSLGCSLPKTPPWASLLPDQADGSAFPKGYDIRKGFCLVGFCLSDLSFP